MVSGVGHGFGCLHQEGSVQKTVRGEWLKENKTIECVHPMGEGCSEHKVFAVDSRNKIRAIKHEITENM